MDAQIVPGLLDLLQREYAKSLHMQQSEIESKAVAAFVDFCDRYLDEHRPVENWPADQNIGVRLSNNQRVLVCPDTAVQSQGTMEMSGSVGITAGRSQPGQEGVKPSGDEREIR